MESKDPDDTLRRMNLNLYILRILEGILLLGMAHIIIRSVQISVWWNGYHFNRIDTNRDIFIYLLNLLPG